MDYHGIEVKYDAFESAIIPEVQKQVKTYTVHSPWSNVKIKDQLANNIRTVDVEDLLTKDSKTSTVIYLPDLESHRELSRVQKNVLNVNTTKRAVSTQRSLE